MNYLKARIAIAFLLCITLNSCKKKVDSAPQTFEDYDVTGEFRVIKNDTTYHPYHLQAGFFPVPKVGGNSNVEFRFTLNADSVLVNGINAAPPYSFPLNGYYLEDIDSIFANGPMNWVVVGRDKVPSFTHLDTQKFADFELSIPDRIDKSKGLDVELHRISDTTNGSAYVYFSAESLDDRLILKSGWNVSLSPAELVGLKSSDQINIVVRSLVRDSVLVNGMRFGFNREVVKSRAVRVE